MKSLSEHEILSYTVRAHERLITFDTEGFNEQATVYFGGVFAYCFLYDILPSVLCEIKESHADYIYSRYLNVFENGRRFGWPDDRFWLEARKAENIKDYIDRLGLRCYLISSYHETSAKVL